MKQLRKKHGPPFVSIIVCTYNGEKTLLWCLESLNKQDYPPDKMEILVIDNASNDNTQKIACNFIKKSRFKCRYIFESELGLSTARNRGIKEAKGEIVVFLDDDMAFPSNWLRLLIADFNNPSIAVVTGKVNLVFPGQKPTWLSGAMMSLLAQTEFGKTARYLNNHEPFLGGNVAFRKKIFKQLGLFRKGLGRKGNSLISLDEVELARRVNKAGYQAFFQPKAWVDHLVRSERMNKKFFLKRFFMEGVSAERLDRLENQRKNYAFLAISFFKALLRLLYRRKFENLCWLFFYFGYFKSKIGYQSN